MISRRKAREVALQVLFQNEFHPNSDALELLNSFADNFQFDQDTREYALYLVDGVLSHQEKLNTEISQNSLNWKIDRMASIDKILLQIAIFEMTVSDQTPTSPQLIMTDIIDLAKKYSSEDAKNFINGILDQIYQKSC